MKCSKSKNDVKWIVDKNFVNNIKYSLLKDKHEVAGSILFKDVNCRGNICDKSFLKDYRVKGEKSSVKTPHGLINYHTHPLQCYIDEGTKYGWPSGEDMAINIMYAKRGTLVHIVFTLEGSYIIKTNVILNNLNIDMLEKLLQETHVYRLTNQKEQLRDFIKKFGIFGHSTVDIWMKLINSITVEKMYKLYNKFYNKNLNVPNDKRKLFKVVRIPLNKPLIFGANFISEKCHKNHFNSFN
jgi:hypothetical protein